MADHTTLTRAYMTNHPVDAARVLDALPSAQTAELLNAIPARVASPVLATMLPTAAARVLDLLADEQALNILNACGTQAAVALLRQLPEPKRSRLISGLSAVTAVASRMLLGFPEDACGSWADPEIVVLNDNATATDALQRLRAAGDSVEGMIYLVDSAGRLAGTVRLNALLRAPEHARLASLAEYPPSVLPAMTPVMAALSLPAWAQTLCLPVVDRDHRLLGVLQRAALMRAAGNRDHRVSENAEHSTVATIAASYWGIVSVLLQALLAVLPKTRRVLPEDQ